MQQPDSALLSELPLSICHAIVEHVAAKHEGFGHHGIGVLKLSIDDIAAVESACPDAIELDVPAALTLGLADYDTPPLKVMEVFTVRVSNAPCGENGKTSVSVLASAPPVLAEDGSIPLGNGAYGQLRPQGEARDSEKYVMIAFENGDYRIYDWLDDEQLEQRAKKRAESNLQQVRVYHVKDRAGKHRVLMTDTEGVESYFSEGVTEFEEELKKTYPDCELMADTVVLVDEGGVAFQPADNARMKQLHRQYNFGPLEYLMWPHEIDDVLDGIPRANWAGVSGARVTDTDDEIARQIREHSASTSPQVIQADVKPNRGTIIAIPAKFCPMCQERARYAPRHTMEWLCSACNRRLQKKAERITRNPEKLKEYGSYTERLLEDLPQA